MNDPIALVGIASELAVLRQRMELAAETQYP